MILNTKYGQVEIFAKTVTETTVGQVVKMANSPLGEGAHIRIMPDCHEGTGCTIGTTMYVTDKVCPNLVGVDIGCGVDLVQLDFDLSLHLDELDAVIRAKIPFGKGVHKKDQKFDFGQLRCFNALDKSAQQLAFLSLGTLGGGNHFIEAYAGENGTSYVAVHSGSRNVGLCVAQYYQRVAKHSCFLELSKERNQFIATLPPLQRELWARQNQIKIDEDLAFLTGADLDDYLHDVGVMQQFALLNRKTMLGVICNAFYAQVLTSISSTHNYIDLESKILRKGAISAKQGELLVIPLNMRDGILICRGKGNPEWNFSAPHGAGRLYSRSIAKKVISLDDYKKSMEGIYSTCISTGTIDECAFAYKDHVEIMQLIQPTVDILKHLKPIYNFKSV